MNPVRYPIVNLGRGSLSPFVHERDAVPFTMGKVITEEAVEKMEEQFRNNAAASLTKELDKTEADLQSSRSHAEALESSGASDDALREAYGTVNDLENKAASLRNRIEQLKKKPRPRSLQIPSTAPQPLQAVPVPPPLPMAIQPVRVEKAGGAEANACYTKGGQVSWGPGGPGYIPVPGYDEATCRALSRGGIPSVPSAVAPTPGISPTMYSMTGKIPTRPIGLFY